MSNQTANSRYIDTRGMSREQWLQARQQGLGGSDIAAIMGLHSFKSPYDVWLDKTGRGQEQEQNTFMRFGSDVEPIIADWFAEDNGMQVQKDNMMWIHPKHSFLIANVDRVILQNDIYEGNGILECKSTNYWRWKQVEDEVPEEWYLQMQHYMMIKGYSWGAIAALVDRQPEYLFFDADPEIHDLIIEHAKQFWEEHVIADEPPAPTTSDDLVDVYAKIKKGKAIEATDEIIDAMQNLQGLKEQKKQIDQAIKEEQHKVEAFIGDKEAELLNHQGEKICKRGKVSYWQPSKSKLQEKYPEVASDPDIQKQITFSRLYY